MAGLGDECMIREEGREDGFNERDKERDGPDRPRVEARAAFENEKARWCLSGGGGTRVLGHRYMRKLAQ